MKVLFTGNYDPAYNRTLVISESLKNQKVEVTQLPIKSKSERKSSSLLEAGKNANYIFLPSFTHSDVKWVRQSFPNKQIIFDPLISKYLTKVFDYQTISKWSPRALKNWWKDKLAMQRADLVVADTKAHRQYFHRTFNIPLEKIKVLYIGVDGATFFPLEKETPTSVLPLKVGFYGSFAPLQGIENIIRTASLLKENTNIQFEIVGGGFDEQKVKGLAKQLDLSNIIFTPTLPFEMLNRKINEWDICLGIFGDSLKTDLVIPNKIFHYAACQKPMITKSTPAIKELFTHSENILLCQNNPEDMATSILKLFKDPELAKRISRNAFHKISTQYSSDKIGEQFIDILNGRI